MKEPQGKPLYLGGVGGSPLPNKCSCPPALPALDTPKDFFLYLSSVSLIFDVDSSRLKTLMLGDQHQLVRFSIKPRHVERITHAQRLMSTLRVRCSKRPPLSLWAGWVLECILSCHLFFLKKLYFLLECGQLTVL